MNIIDILIIIGYIVMVYVSYYILRRFIYTKPNQTSEVLFMSSIWPISLIALPFLCGFALIEEYLLNKN